MSELWGGLAALAIIGGILLAAVDASLAHQLLLGDGGLSATELDNLWPMAGALGGAGLLLTLLTPLSAKKSGRRWVNGFVVFPAVVLLHQTLFLAALTVAPARTEAYIVRANINGSSSTTYRRAGLRDQALVEAFIKRHPRSEWAGRLASYLLVNRVRLAPKRVADLVIGLYHADPNKNLYLINGLRKQAVIGAHRADRVSAQLLYGLMLFDLGEGEAGLAETDLARMLIGAGAGGSFCLEVAVPEGTPDSARMAQQLSAVAQAIGDEVRREVGLSPRIGAAEARPMRHRCLRLSLKNVASDGPYLPLARLSEAPGRWTALELTAAVVRRAEPSHPVLVQAGFRSQGPLTRLWRGPWKEADTRPMDFQLGARQLAQRTLWTLLHRPKPAAGR